MTHTHIDSDGRAASALGPGMEAFLAAFEAAFPPDIAQRSLAEQRACYAELCRRFEASRPADVAVADRRVEGRGGAIPVRVYRPAHARPDAVCLYLHGGGWTLGDLDSHDGIVAGLAARSGIATVAAAYRLAPEHPFPAAVHDAADVARTIVERPGTLDLPADARLLLAGDSAGGNLAAALTLLARAGEIPPAAGGLLIYPALTFDYSGGSYETFAEAPALSVAEMHGYRRAYLGRDAPCDDPLAAPLAAARLDGLPPMVLLAAGIDPLRDDACRFAARLRDAGVPVNLSIAEGLVHGFLRARGHCPAAAAAFQWCGDWLRRLAAAHGG